MLGIYLQRQSRGFHEEMHSSVTGLFTLFLGGMAHLFCGPPA